MKQIYKDNLKNFIGYSVLPINKFFLRRNKYINRTLLFHSIDETLSFDTYGFTVNLNSFKKYINLLIVNNYDFHDFNNIIKTKKSISITFDDGYKNILPAIEFLIKLEIPSTIFIITSKIDDKLYLSSKDIYELSKNNLITIGSHSHSHLKFSNFTSNIFFSDIMKSINIIEDITGKNVKSFSFPYGSYKLEYLMTLKNMKINNICTSNYGFNNNFLHPINRIEIIKNDDVNSFLKKITGFYDYLYLKKFLIN